MFSTNVDMFKRTNQRFHIQKLANESTNGALVIEMTKESGQSIKRESTYFFKKKTYINGEKIYRKLHSISLNILANHTFDLLWPTFY